MWGGGDIFICYSPVQTVAPSLDSDDIHINYLTAQLMPKTYFSPVSYDAQWVSYRCVKMFHFHRILMVCVNLTCLI